jgi:serine/threonine protein kinase
MDSDRNLLFGVLALLTDAVSRDQFVEACTSWSARKHVSMGDLLVERGWLTPADRANVEMVLERKLKKHQGDTKAGLAEVAGDSVRQSLFAIGDPEVQQSLAAVAVAGTVIDRRTADYQPLGRSRYTLARLHAKGGIGQVWVARDADLGREVALKELLGDHGENPALISRFLEEAKITGQLEHPNIVPVYELASPAGPTASPFYTMRFVRGRTLAAAIRDYHRKRLAGEAGPVELRELLGHYVAVCNALAYAHSRGVLHRDLKPGNIVLGDYGEAIVLDWGLAKIKGSQDRQTTLLPVTVPNESARDATMQGQVLGTPAYMSPEQAEGRLDLIDERSDIYGLGAILYEILAGEPPFSGPETANVLSQVIHEPPVPPRQRVPATPRALEAICLQALAKKPADRYRSAKELAADVQRWMADEPVSAWPEPLRLRAGRWARRHRSFVASAAVLLLSAVAALSAGTILLSQANARTKEQRDLAEANFVEAQRAGEDARKSAERAELALTAEASARQQTRKALDEMSSQVIADWLSQKDLKLDAAQEKFLNNSLAYYQSFAEEAGDNEDVRWGAADAHLRIGDIDLKLSRLADAEKANRKAIDAFAALAKDYPDRPRYPAKEATAYSNLAMILWETGKPKESETAHLQSLSLRQKLTKAYPDQAEYHQDLGNSYKALAVVYASTRRPNEADDSYRKALAELETLVKQLPAEKAYRSSLATVRASWAVELSDRGRLKEAEATDREALAMRRQLVAESPDQPNYRHDLAKSYNSLGRTLKDMGRNKEAEEADREDLALCKQLAADYPSIAVYRDSLAAAYQHLGILYAGTGRTKDAEPVFRDSLAVRKQLAADFPSSVNFRVGLTYSLNNLGVFLYTTGRSKEAEALYREAIDITRRLADASPTVSEYRERLGGRLYNLAILLQTLKRLDQAEAAYREATSVFKKLTAELPNVPSHRRSLAKCLNGLSGILNDRGHLDEADLTVRESVEVLRRLVSENPKAPDYREDLAVCLDNRGLFLLDLKKPADAVASHREAEQIYEALVRANPEEPHYGEELARTLIHQAIVERDRKEYAKALPLLDRARPLLEAAIKANPKYDVYQKDTRSHRSELAACLAGTGKLVEALATAEGIAKLDWKPATDAYETACALAKCIPVIEGQASLSPERRAEQSRLFSERASAALRLAVDKGYSDAGKLKENEDLRPLRDRKDYQELVAELEKKSGQGK